MKVANQEAVDAVEDMKRGLHMAMTEFIRNREYDKAEQILHQLDQTMVRWINDTKVVCL
jgi:hypothetical protein